MCSCDWDYVCLAHRDTPEDPAYESWERPEPVYSDETAE